MSDEHIPIGLATATANSGDLVVAHPSQIEVSLRGEAFDIHADEWKLSTRITLKVNPLRALMAPGLQEGLTMTLCHLARNRAPQGLQQLSTILKDYAKRVNPGKTIADWRVVYLQNYRETLIQRFGHEAYLSRLRSFLKAWHDLRYPGTDRKVYEALKEMTLKGPETGRAVRSMDPEEGPLEPTELHTLAKDIQSAYDQDTLDLDHFSLCLFHIATGRRPSQSANLKCKDLDEGRALDPVSTSESGDSKAPTETLLLMHVPRSKQRAATFRDAFRSVQWAPEFFAIFRMQQRMVQREFESLLASQDWALQTQDLLALQTDLPLFPDWKRILASLEALAPVRQDGRHGQALQDLRAVAAGAQWHHSGQEITILMQVAVKVAGSISRTGEPLSINALRLRHTKGTDLAREGLGRDIIAWLLDHSTVESVKVYTDNLPEHAIPANAAMALSPTMRNLAQLFRGQIVDSEADALAGDDPQSSRIHFKGKGTATCGTRKQCGMSSRIPLCCYECDDFQPWLEGPHLDVLSELLIERHQREDTLGKDHRVTKAADSTIVAIINVIQKCEVRRQELSDQKYPEGAEVDA